jgi:hypothetical protein
MKPNIVEIDAVLKAADEWVSAQEVLIAAQQVSDETDAEREGVDVAGSRLVVAVTRWREAANLYRPDASSAQLSPCREGCR